MTTDTQLQTSRFATRYGPWAVVTGASDGIGRASALELARHGVHVVLVARREPELAAVARDVEALGARAAVVVADLSTQAGIDQLLAATEERDVGLLVAAAGYGTSGGFLDNEIDDEIDMLDVNCRAVVKLSHHFGRRFVARGRGGLVLFSSLVAFQGVPFAAHYAATKAYIQNLAEGLHVELADHGVDVLASAPGPTSSGFARRADMKMGRTVPADVVARQTLRALGRRMTVRPGFLSKFLELALKMPRWGRVRIMRLVMGGMTRHQLPSQAR